MADIKRLSTLQLLHEFPEFEPAWDSTTNKNVRYYLRKAMLEMWDETGGQVMLDTKLSEKDIRLLIDTVDRRLEEISASYHNQPLPLVSISLKSTKVKLETELGKILMGG